MKLPHVVLALALPLAGCTGGGGSAPPSDPMLTSGTYVVSASLTLADGCSIGPGLSDGTTLPVFVDGTSLTIGALSTIIEGERFAFEATPIVQLSSDGAKSCAATITDVLAGTIVADDAFDADERYEKSVENPSGWPGCPFQACASEWTFHAAK